MAAKRKKAATSDSLESRLDSLVADLEALQTDVRGLAQGVGTEANERVTTAIRAAEERVATTLQAAEAAAEQAMDQAEVWASNNIEYVRENVREQPIVACAAAMGVGALLGLILFRR